MSEAGEREGGSKKRFITTQVEIEGRVERKVVEVPDYEPEPWGPNAELTIVGTSVPRVDAPTKVRGAAKYTADIQLAGMLHVAVARSPIAAGTFLGVDAAAARRVPGVWDVVTAADLETRAKVQGIPVLSPEILYAGQPLVAVVAESMEAARRGIELLSLNCEASPHATTFADAVAEGAPAVRRNGNLWPGSPRITERGDVAAGFSEADVVIEREFTTPSALHSAMEPHGAVAQWEGDGDRLTIWESTQGVFRVRNDVARGLGIPQSHVRVIKDYMGGGFGAKSGAGVYTFLAAIMARRHGRPVRCVFDRFGEQVDAGHRASTRQIVKLGATREGHLLAIDMVAEIAQGVSGWEASVGSIYHEMYSCPNVRTQETFAFTHSQGMQSFRGPGHVEGAFGLERAMDVLARELQLDPLELRRLNFAERDESKDRPFSSNSLLACYDQGAARFDWANREKRRNDVSSGPMVTASDDARNNLSSGGPPGATRNIKRGFGVAAQVWGAGGGPPAYATARVNTDGTIDILSGTQDLGTGSRTILAQIAAEAIGASPKDVRVILGDTERTPYAGTSWGSMTTPSVGPAVRSAAELVQQRLVEAAAGILDASPDDITISESVIRVRDSDKQITLADLTRKLGNVMIIAEGSRGPNPQGTGISSFGVQFAEVEVDVETGVVRVIHIVAAHDVGRVINPLLASSQLEGGIIQGLGFALGEERLLDRNSGRPVNPSLHDYKLPTFSDVPRIDAFCVDGADTVANHIGARGLAEPPIIPTAPAIANAVADALGVEVNDLPLTPWRLLMVTA